MRRAELLLLSAFALLLPTIANAADPQKAQGAGIVSGTITIDGKPTTDVVVSIEGLPPQKLKDGGAGSYYRLATMGQRDLKFYPYVLPVLVGATVNFVNDDKVWHNVYSTSEAKKFDLGLYAPGKSKSVTFDKPGIVRVLCNVHPTMEAYIVVKEHPYFTSPDKDGNYRFSDVPLGTYRLTVWHPSLGTRAEPFTLDRADEVLQVDIDLKKAK
jgi:plastocyanin